MATDLVTPNVEQRYIIKFLVKMKMNYAEIVRRLNAQYEETLSCASVYDWYNNFSEGRKEQSCQLAQYYSNFLRNDVNHAIRKGLRHCQRRPHCMTMLVHIQQKWAGLS
jgi:hypothetical protein